MNEISNIRVVFLGTPDFVIPIAQKITKHYELVGVVTSPDAPFGRKKIITPSPIKTWYMQYLLTQNKEGVILTPDELTEDIAIKLRKLHPDLFIVAAYGKLVPRSILNIPRLGSINIHPSSLPTYRGPSPIQTALLNGDKTLGISFMQMDDELDHGPILTQWEIPIEETDTFESLHTKSFLAAAEKLPQVIEQLKNGHVHPLPQDDTKATFTHKITRQDGYFDINNPPNPEKLNQMIKAYYPWPTAWTKVRIKNNELRIMKFLPHEYVQLEGKNATKLKELINGYPELQEQLINLHLDS